MAVSDDWTVNFTLRRFEHSSGSDQNDVIDFYDWAQSQIATEGGINDIQCVEPQTPWAIKITRGWYIKDGDTQYLKGGSITTYGWDATSFNYGIRKLTFVGDPGTVIGDLGREVGYVGGTPADTGTLLDYDNTNKIWWVRVDDTGDTFANTGTAINLDDGGGTGTGTLSQASETGESVWSNAQNQTSLLVDTPDVYMYQNELKITSWWAAGDMDVLIRVKENGTLVDTGDITLYCREYGYKYYHWLKNIANVGSENLFTLTNPVDTYNETAQGVMLYDNEASGPFVADEVVTGGTSGATATVKSVTDWGTEGALFLLNVDGTFSDNEEITGGTSSATGDVNGSASGCVGGFLIPYDTESGFPFTLGETLTGDANSYTSTLLGIQDNGSDGYIIVSEPTGVYVDDETLSGGTSSASVDVNGAVIETAMGYTDIDLTFGETSQDIGDGDGNQTYHLIIDCAGRTFLELHQYLKYITMEGSTFDCDGTPGQEYISLNASYTENKESPFGPYQGGKYYGAQGVWVTNYDADEANKRVLIDSAGVERIPPLSVPLKLTGGVDAAWACIYIETVQGSLDVDKDLYAAAAGNDSGDPDIVVKAAIDTDVPSSGFVRILDDRYAYSSYASATFTLDVTAHPGGLSTNYTEDDGVYAGFIDQQFSGTSINLTTLYQDSIGDRWCVVRARKAGYLPFEVEQQFTETGINIPVNMAVDPIYGS